MGKEKHTLFTEEKTEKANKHMKSCKLEQWGNRDTTLFLLVQKKREGQRNGSQEWRNGRNSETHVLREGAWTSAVILQANLIVPVKPGLILWSSNKKMHEDIHCNSICGIWELEALWVPLTVEESGRKPGMYTVKYYVAEAMDPTYVDESQKHFWVKSKKKD